MRKIVGVVLSLASWDPAAARGLDDHGRTHLVIHLQTYVALPELELRRALDHASRAFRAAGIDVEWRPTRTAAAAEYTLLLLSPDMSALKCLVDGLGPEVLGSAAPGAGRAWIFVDRITEVANGQGLPVSDILGQVIAHEAGHLVLAADVDPIGIMRERVQLTGAIALRFTDRQAARMRDRLRGEPGVLARTAR